jgi:hypothetical protein
MFAKAGRGFGARAVGFYSKGCDAFYLGYQVEWLVQHVGFYLCGVAGEAELVAQPGAIVVARIGGDPAANEGIELLAHSGFGGPGLRAGFGDVIHRLCGGLGAGLGARGPGELAGGETDFQRDGVADET